MKKAWIAIVVIGVLLVACLYFAFLGPGKEVGPTSQSPSGPLVANAPNVVSVSALLPLSGTSAFLGQGERRGLLAMESLLESEKDIDLEINYADTKNEARTAITAYRREIQVTNPDVIITTHSGVSGPISEILANEGGSDSTVVATIVASTKVTQNNEDMIRAYVSGRAEATAMAKYAVSTLGLKKIALIFQNDDYGADALAEFSPVVERLGSQIVFSSGFEKQGQDTKPIAAVAIASAPDGVYVIGNTPTYAQVFRSLRELGFTGTLLGGSGFDIKSLREVAGDQSIAGVIYTSMFHESDAMLNDSRYKAWKSALAEQDADPGLLTFYPAVALEIGLGVKALDKNTGLSLNEQLSDANIQTIGGLVGFDSERNAKLPIYIKESRSVDPIEDILLEITR